MTDLMATVRRHLDAREECAESVESPRPDPLSALTSLSAHPSGDAKGGLAALSSLTAPPPPDITAGMFRAADGSLIHPDYLKVPPGMFDDDPMPRMKPNRMADTKKGD